ncbi:TauD/TfdA family dioxygenase [Hahella sp. CR1]|uniref:TauD/TfdA family dioxygenase n=1 Tax=Hahella sp. CR1 TaxID=2992807 RepID=UPI002441CB24|nr:TauD/TfdA family dioxygenase [Hahella sp. CR1]MDG9667733.1 TauD/TfdA family dioxygenase [Hahella sp. CR1]
MTTTSPITHRIPTAPRKAPERQFAFTGYLVQAQEGDTLDSVSADDFHFAMEQKGVALFRGYEATPERFGDFVEKFSSRLILDPTRQSYDRRVQRVLSGTPGIELHSEHSNSPFTPDYIWFYCRRAAGDRGQTTYCDGLEIWRSLSETSRTFIENVRFIYRRLFPEMFWKVFVAFMIDEDIPVEEINRDHLEKLFNGLEGVRIELNADNQLDFSYSTYVYNQLPGGHRALANSLTGPYPGQTVTMEDGSPIPHWLMGELKSLYDLHTRDIPWRDGDIAVLNNKRMMHGRRPSEDMGRELFSALSYG